ncbi:amidohydrolase family protein [Streptomyces sp. NPDC004629]|uniref:amidohydrolase family protein n=1 Tax=Streptomyces sp. NPDC004629 TaxID=3364705 RepID=UPI003683EB45
MLEKALPAKSDFETGTNTIIDARVCPPIPAFLQDRTWTRFAGTLDGVRSRGWIVDGAMKSPDLSAYLDECKRLGIARAGLTARVPNEVWGGRGNLPVFEAVAQRPEFFFAYGAVDALAADPGAAVQQLKDRGVRGVVVEPGLAHTALHIDDRRVDPVYDACQAIGLPLLLMGGGETGPDLSYSDPLRHEQVAIRFPRLQIVYMHGGWPFVQAALGVAFRRPNVWMMPDVYFPGLPGEQDYLLAMRTYLQDRFLFASNYPYCPLTQIVERYHGFGLPDDLLTKVLHGNARRLFFADADGAGR